MIVYNLFEGGCVGVAFSEKEFDNLNFAKTNKCRNIDILQALNTINMSINSDETPSISNIDIYVSQSDINSIMWNASNFSTRFKIHVSRYFVDGQKHRGILI